MAVTKGESCFVLLISHQKLPDERYFVEKEDGNSEWRLNHTMYMCICLSVSLSLSQCIVGYVKKSIAQRVSIFTVLCMISLANCTMFD